MTREMPPAIAIIGYSGAGKTTLVAQLTRELADRGYRVGTVKHASHGFEIDREGKDPRRLFAAGSHTTAIVGPDKLAMVTRVQHEPDIEDVIAGWFSEHDIVLVEGFKASRLPRIEIYITGQQEPVSTDSGSELLAIVSAGGPAMAQRDVPVYSRDDISGLADLLERQARPGRGQ